MNLKNKINKNQNRNRVIDTENVLMVARWEGCWEMGKKGEGIRGQIDCYRIVMGVYRTAWGIQ